MQTYLCPQTQFSLCIRASLREGVEDAVEAEAVTGLRLRSHKQIVAKPLNEMMLRLSEAEAEAFVAAKTGIGPRKAIK